MAYTLVYLPEVPRLLSISEKVHRVILSLLFQWKALVPILESTKELWDGGGGG